MPGFLHEKFAVELGALLNRKFDEMRTNKDTSEKEHEILNAISLGGSPRLELSGGSDREPDVCFLHKHARGGPLPSSVRWGMHRMGCVTSRVFLSNTFSEVAERYELSWGSTLNIVPQSNGL
jgi:hypothetical protein